MKKLTIKDIIIIALSAVCTTLVAVAIVFGVAFGKKEKQISKMQKASAETYDFYITMGTMPTLYATINAYDNANPNTYMWFYRGNTISKEYSADFIHYFDTQSETNANSEVDYMLIRQKVAELRENNPYGKFHLYCDDIRVRYVLDIFVAAGVDFEDLQVTLLSDGTQTYQLYSQMTEESYAGLEDGWNAFLKEYVDNRANSAFTKYSEDGATELEKYAFYLATKSNVSYWMQHPDYLENTISDSINTDRYNMNIVKKDPKAMYNSLDEKVKQEYQKVVLANALVDSETLKTLDDAVEYFDSQLANRDKDVVLILGTKFDTLATNQTFMDQTIAYYTPTLKNATTVSFKGKDYTISSGATEFVADDEKTYTIGELSVYLFFKGHPAYPAKEDLAQYFEEKGIVVLPHRTPVETLFWMYDVKVGGYESTSFFSCEQGQVEFFYGALTIDALKEMQDLGFFDGAATFTN